MSGFDLSTYILTWMGLLFTSWFTGWLFGFIFLTIRRFMEQI